jgi:hypothetical protein
MPHFIKVDYHQAYNVDTIRGTDFYSPSLIALDKNGRVWRTFQLNNGEWAPWTCINNFE